MIEDPFEACFDLKSVLLTLLFPSPCLFSFSVCCQYELLFLLSRGGGGKETPRGTCTLLLVKASVTAGESKGNTRENVNVVSCVAMYESQQES